MRTRFSFMAALIVGVVTGLGNGPPALAQDAASGEPPKRAMLVSGPAPVKGIPVYAPNRIPVFEGLYELQGEGQGEAVTGGSGEQGASNELRVGEAGAGEAAAPAEAPAGALQLKVLYAPQELFIPQSWVPVRCGSWRLYRVPDYESPAYCYRDERGFYLFFLFAEEEPAPDWCAFTNPFIERFLFLYNFVDSRTDIPFPAIVEMR